MTVDVVIKGESGVADVDPVGGLCIIDLGHRRLHQGKMFQTTRVQNAVVAQGLALTLIRTPISGTKPHLALRASAAGDLRLDFFEAPTVTATGTTAGLRNRNRNSSKTALISIFDAPTISANGVRLLSEFLPQGLGGNFTNAAGAGQFDEWVLKENTDYLVQVRNVSAGSLAIGIGVLWYEPGT